MIGRPTRGRREDSELHAALRGKFERVRQEVLQHLLQPLRVGDDRAVEIGRNLHIEIETAVFRLVAERPRHRVEQVRKEDFLRIDRNRAGFDLREIENVGDEVQQVGAGAVNRAGELDLPLRQIALWILLQLLPEDQDRVQRRPQLVAHIGQKLGFVLRGESEFGGLFFHGAPRLLDFLVLGFHFDIALGELLRLLLELLVRLLQFALLRLQFGGELLGLCQQAFRLHGRFDRVQHDADAGRQLFEEGELQLGKC